MFNWGAFTLFLYITARMSGFILFNPIFGRNGVPTMYKAGVILVLAVTAYTSFGGTAEAPVTLLGFAFKLLMEMSVGAVIAVVMRFFFYIPEQAGELVDTQMGMSMAKTYDPTSQSQITSTASLLNVMASLIFFASGAHITLLRLMCTSGEILPYGHITLSAAMNSRIVELFAQCALLSVKLGFPVLAAELMGQIGMGILMKVIPQINVFAINIELKVIIGMAMLIILVAPIGNFLLQTETAMIGEIRRFLIMAGQG